MLITPESVPQLDEPDNGLTMRRLVTREGHWGSVSATWVELDGRHQRLRNDHSDRIYYVLEGQARFRLGEEEPIEATAGDAVLIPRATPYELQGRLRYLVISAPATHPDDNIYLEGPRMPPSGPPPSLRAAGRAASEGGGA